MNSDQNSNNVDKDEIIRNLTSRLDEMEKRVERLEKEMSAIGKMEGAIKSIFRAGEAKDGE
jgi:chaperonin cofactor prefoldin